MEKKDYIGVVRQLSDEGYTNFCEADVVWHIATYLREYGSYGGRAAYTELKPGTWSHKGYYGDLTLSAIVGMK